MNNGMGPLTNSALGTPDVVSHGYDPSHQLGANDKDVDFATKIRMKS
jgi:hypothetical protein